MAEQQHYRVMRATRIADAKEGYLCNCGRTVIGLPICPGELQDRKAQQLEFDELVPSFLRRPVGQ